MTAVRMTALVRGHVQGVGFRMWTQRVAQGLALTGSAVNLPDGSVRVVAEGPRLACAHLLEALRGTRAPGRVSGVEVAWDDVTPSDAAGGEDRSFTTG